MFRYNKKSIEMYDRELNQLGVIDTGAINLFSLSKVSKEKDYLLVSFSLDVSSKTHVGEVPAGQDVGV